MPKVGLMTGVKS